MWPLVTGFCSLKWYFQTSLCSRVQQYHCFHPKWYFSVYINNILKFIGVCMCVCYAYSCIHVCGHRLLWVYMRVCKYAEARGPDNIYFSIEFYFLNRVLTFQTKFFFVWIRVTLWKLKLNAWTRRTSLQAPHSFWIFLSPSLIYRCISLHLDFYMGARIQIQIFMHAWQAF